MAHDVFISYASEDLAAAKAIRAALNANGIIAWLAPDSITPGEPYGVAISNGIKASRVFVLVFSQHANESEHVPREVERAVHLGIPIVPVRLGHVEPSSSLEHFLSVVHRLDASNPPRPEDLESLAQAVKKWLEVRQKPATSSNAAPAPTAAPLRLALLYKRHIKTDEALLKWLEAAFTARGCHVFIDRHLGVGVEWAKELDRRIREADAVIPLISADSVRSEMLASELQIAFDESQKRQGNPRILPIRINFEGELPSELAGVLDRLHYFLWKSPDDNARLISELTGALEKPSVETPRGASADGRPAASFALLRRSSGRQGNAGRHPSPGQRYPDSRRAAGGQNVVAGPWTRTGSRARHPRRHD